MTVVEVQVIVRREHRHWTAETSPHSPVAAWSDGRSLKELQERTDETIRWVLNAAPADVDITYVMETPALVRLVQARDATNTALTDAVTTLRSLGTTWTDIARACQVPGKVAREIWHDATR